jgi:phosphate transport system protein
VDAFVKRDLALARRIIEMDDVIDDLFDIVKYELIECTAWTPPAASRPWTF